MGATPSTGTITTDKGTTLSGLILSCIGGKPNTAEFAASLPAGSIAPNGAVNVESTLQVVGLRNVFAAGDVAATPEEKTANYADYAGLCVARNIAALDAGKELVTFPGGLFGGATKLPMLAGASLGSKNGVMQMGTDVQAGPATAYLRAFFVKMYCRTIAGSWVWGLVFRGVKGMFAGQIKTLALKASKEGAGAA